MVYLIVGLGNPGDKYERTRHNAGCIALEDFRYRNNFTDWRKNGVARALVSTGEIGGKSVTLVLPETFMNESGKSVVTFTTKEESGARLIVVHDDLDLPIGEFKMSFGSGSAGHNGIESIISSLGTKDFIRIRIGISPKTFFGKLKKPKGQSAVEKFVLGKLSGSEMRKIENSAKDINKMIGAYLEKGRQYAMNHYN